MSDSSEKKQIEGLLANHKEALNAYREWDQKVKDLLKGRRLKDLTQEGMVQYKEASIKRDAAYDQMRHHERSLLDNIPGASTGTFPAITPEDLKKKK